MNQVSRSAIDHVSALGWNYNRRYVLLLEIVVNRDFHTPFLMSIAMNTFLQTDCHELPCEAEVGADLL